MTAVWRNTFVSLSKSSLKTDPQAVQSRRQTSHPEGSKAALVFADVLVFRTFQSIYLTLLNFH